MARHHFVPAFILKKFASSEAWRWAPKTNQEKIRERDEKIIMNKAKYRKWPVCVYDKVEKRFRRGEVDSTCSRERLYEVPDYDDPAMRAITHLDYGRTVKRLPYSEALKLADRPIDPEILERIHLGRIDSQFSSLTTTILDNDDLTEEEFKIVLRFLRFAIYRTAHYRDKRFPVIAKKHIDRHRRQLAQLKEAARQMRSPLEQTFEKMQEAADETTYHMSLMERSDNWWSIWKTVTPKLVVLSRQPNSVPFVLGDNPARAYDQQKVQQISYKQVPGIRFPNIRITHPISPDFCIMITTNERYKRFDKVALADSDIRRINTAQAYMATKEVIFPVPDERIFVEGVEMSRVKVPQYPC